MGIEDRLFPEGQVFVKPKEYLSTAEMLHEMVEEMNQQEDLESFYIMDVDDVIEKHRKWETCLPRIKPHFAVKCNDSPLLLNLLADLGVNFDCSSKGDIERILKIGVPPERIVFANPIKLVSHIRFARESGVDLMTFDTIEELHKMKIHFPKARLLLRVAKDAKKALQLLSSKFGAPPSEVTALLDTAKSLQLNIAGVAFHVGSACLDNSAYRDALSVAKNIFLEAKQRGFTPNIVDIGGGFPGTPDFDLKSAASVVNSALEEMFDNEVTVIAEPGRYYCTSAFTLVTKIISLKHSTDAIPTYVIPDGILGSFNTAIYNTDYITVESLKSGKPVESRIIGMSGRKEDLLKPSCLLPESLQIGDWFLFPNLGDYSMTLRILWISRTPMFYTVSFTNLLYFKKYFIGRKQTDEEKSHIPEEAIQPLKAMRPQFPIQMKIYTF